MRVACPECAAEYDLPPAVAARLDGGKTVRCARCGTTWSPPPPAAESTAAAGPPVPEPPMPGPEATGPETAEPDAIEPEAAFPESALRPPEPPPAEAAEPLPAPAGGTLDRSRVTALAWAASLLLLAGAAGAAWLWRIELVEAWPPAARAFIALGLAG